MKSIEELRKEWNAAVEKQQRYDKENQRKEKELRDQHSNNMKEAINELFDIYMEMCNQDQQVPMIVRVDYLNCMDQVHTCDAFWLSMDTVDIGDRVSLWTPGNFSGYDGIVQDVYLANKKGVRYNTYACPFDYVKDFL